MARGFQYQALFETLGPPPCKPGTLIFTNPVITPPIFAIAMAEVDQAERTKRLQYQALAWTPHPVLVVGSPPIGWLEQWEQPQPKRKFKPAEPQWVPQPVSTPATIGWLEPWDQPGPKRHLQPVDFHWLPQVQSTVTPTMGWLEPWSQPKKPIKPFRWETQWTPQPVPTIVPPVGWLETLSRPQAHRPRLQPEMLWWTPQVPVTSCDWNIPWSQPQRRTQQLRSELLWTPGPPPVPQLGWLGEWLTPRAKKHHSFESFGDAPAFASFTPTGWLGEWSTPLQRRRSLILQEFESLAPPTFLVPAVSWLQEWSQPYRRDARPVPQYPAEVQSPEVPPLYTIPSFGWFEPLSLPYRRNWRPIPENPFTALGVGTPFIYAPKSATQLAWSSDRRLTATFAPGITMSQAATLEPPIDPGEQETVGFDYGPALATGVALQNVQPTINIFVSQVSPTADGAPQSRLASTVQTLVSSKKTGAADGQWNILFGPPVPGVVYLLQCLALTTDGQTLSIWVRLPADRLQ